MNSTNQTTKKDSGWGGIIAFIFFIILIFVILIVFVKTRENFFLFHKSTKQYLYIFFDDVNEELSVGLTTDVNKQIRWKFVTLVDPNTPSDKGKLGLFNTDAQAFIGYNLPVSSGSQIFVSTINVPDGRSLAWTFTGEEETLIVPNSPGGSSLSLVPTDTESTIESTADIKNNENEFIFWYST